MSNSVKKSDIWDDFAPLDQLNTNPFAKNRFFLAKEFSLMTKTADLTHIMTSLLYEANNSEATAYLPPRHNTCPSLTAFKVYNFALSH